MEVTQNKTKLKYKVIENEMRDFVIELNSFTEREDIEVVNIQYSTSGLAPKDATDMSSVNMHNALISYYELEKESKHVDKDKLIKWLKEEIYGCNSRGNIVRANAIDELLLKVERDYFI